MLVSDYTMVLLSLLLKSYCLKYSSNVQLSLNHLTRIVTTKYQLFLKSSKSRIIPRFVVSASIFTVFLHSHYPAKIFSTHTNSDIIDLHAGINRSFGEQGTLFELTKHVFTLTFSPEDHVRDITGNMYLKLYHLIPGHITVYF